MDDISKILQISKGSSIQQEQDAILLQPCMYISKIPSSQNRSDLCRVFNHWLNIPEEKLQLISEIVQVLQNAISLVDNIEDDSTLHRGMKVVHSVYGLGSTVNAANYSVCIAMDKVHMLNNTEAMKVFTEQMLESYRGQGMEMFWRNTCTVPTLAEYRLMVVRTSGGLLMLSIGLMQLFSRNKKDFSKLIVILGLYYKILDDYSNMTTKDNSGNNSFCEYLTVSLPIIHAVRNEKYRKLMFDIFRQRRSNVEVKKYCIGLLERAGSLKYTRDVLVSLDKRAREEANKLGPNPYMESLLNDLLLLNTKTDQ